MTETLTDTLAWVIGHYATMREKDFLLRWQSPVLLWERVPSTSRTLRPWKTKAHQLPMAPEINHPKPQLSASDTLVLPLKKTLHNPYRDRIYVGRAPGNDIVLDDVNVSKSHAFFSVVNVNGWTLTDTGSTNGTTADAGELTPNMPHRLPPHARILFGLSCTIYYAVPEILFLIVQEAHSK